MVILVMGTTGAGKTTIGRLLSARLGWTFLDADDFHPRSNIEKMKHGIPLTDVVRIPWLENIHTKLVQLAASGANSILACSALKQTYRDHLSAGLDMRVVYLRGSYQAMRQHILSRRGHFAGEAILAGQFADLEEPLNALVLDVQQTPDELVSDVVAQLHLTSPRPPVQPL
jgi:gluconokinase